jgi:tol-pal system protein YbgF
MRGLIRVTALRFVALQFAAAPLLLVGLALSTPVNAQSELNSLRAQIELLQQEILTMRGQLSDVEGVVYGGAEPPPRQLNPQGSAADDRLSQRLAVLETRFDQLDEWRRQVSGRFDEVQNLISRVDSRIERLVADVDFRLSALEAADRRSATQEAPAAANDPVAGTQNTTVARVADGTISADTSESYRPSGEPRSLGTIRVDESGQTVTGDAQQQVARVATPDGQYEMAYDLMRQTRYDEAEIAFNNFMEDNPGHQLVENAAYWRGETYYARKMYGEAARIYASNLQAYPSGTKAADNMVKLGMSLVSLKRNEEACQAFGQLEQAFPDMPVNVRQAAARGRTKANCP